MYFTTILASLSALGMVLAQNNGTSSSNVVTIQVGATAATQGGIFQFIPNSVTASNGTVINFQFSGMPGNHSISQSTFAAPCTPMEGGFDSGWVLLPTAGEQPIPQWNLTITDDSKPIWFFCKQLIPQPHCPSGMVGAVNPPTTGNTIEAFRNTASAVTSVPQIQNGLVGVGASASARPGPLPSGATDFPLNFNGVPSGTGSAPPSTTSTSSAINLSVGSGFIALMAAMTGVFFA
jgi:plastocyanin